MGPYLAVILDSFHSALSSRILWVAFIAIWVLIAVLAPIGYREDFTTSFRGQDFDNGTRMKAMLAQGLVDPTMKDQPIGRIAAAMPDDLTAQLEQVGEGDDVRIRLRELADALNELLEEESWYDAEAWSSTVRLKELRELDEMADDDLSQSLRKRRARLRLVAAFPGVFETRAARSIMLTYAGLDFPSNFAVDKTQFITLINQFVIPTIIDWLLGFVLVFLGILVTASIVPDMLQPGSLHLLLSKPISRSLLLLSKFVGGCAFVLLCVIQLVVGLYIVAGLRLDVWNARMLWCIPASVFLFSVFYSVSIVAGLRWRSPILAIGVTCIFGAFCMTVGIIGGLFDAFVTGPEKIQHVAYGGDTLIASTAGGGLVRYDPDENCWDEVLKSGAMNNDRVLPPITLDDQRIATARVRGGRFNSFGLGAFDLLVLSASEDWEPQPSIRLPTATTRLYNAGKDWVLALNTSGLAITDRSSILQALGEKPSGKEDASQDESSSNGPVGLFAKLTNMMGTATAGFASVLPERTVIMPPRGVVVGNRGDWLIALSRGRMFRLQRPNSGGPWSQTAENQLDGEPSRTSVFALSGNLVMVSRAEEPIQFFQASSLRSSGTIDIPKSLAPLAAVGLGDGVRFALLTSDGKCRIVTASDTPKVGDPLNVSDVNAIEMDTAGKRLIIVHHVDQVDFVDVGTLSVVARIRPTLESWRLVDRYVVSPLRMVTPQTGELISETITSVVSGKTAVSFSNGTSEEVDVYRYDILRPVASCAGFIVVMLTIGCVYFSTRDF